MHAWQWIGLEKCHVGSGNTRSPSLGARGGQMTNAGKAQVSLNLLGISLPLAINVSIYGLLPVIIAPSISMTAS